MVELIWSIIAVLGSILLIVVILWSLATGRGDRDREEDARRYFDEHGHWPDEASRTRPVHRTRDQRPGRRS